MCPEKRVMVSGLVMNGTAAAREWETSTIKELLLAPVAQPAIMLGKVLAGFVAMLLLGVLTFALSAALGWTRPTGIYWVISVGVMALITFLGTGLGVALGSTFRRIQLVSLLSLLLAFYLFFLAGRIGVLAFEPNWLQQIAAYSPLTYGVHALQQTVLYSASNQLGRDIVVLSVSSLVALGLGSLATRRGIAG